MQHINIHNIIGTVIVVYMLAIISGCGEMQRRELIINDLRENIWKLNKSESEYKTRVEELNSKVSTLQERLSSTEEGLKTADKEIDELKTMSIPVKPPEELKVVKITPEETIKKEPAKIEQVKEEQKVKETKPVQTPASQKDEIIPAAEILYREAHELYKARRLEEAISRFRKMIQHYPKSPLADNAYYWIGEAYYSNKDFVKALNEFKKVLEIYPDENKAPDAMLKIGLTHLEMGDKNKARESFKKLTERYPRSDAADKAKVRLKEK
ncbi:MAG: tol-pal system protein YbgF [Deltaproteobacteria bacterium]|nr:tol-pal system protein YbgF [Deltaproteobacteria bacterium]